MSQSGADIISLDWTVSVADAQGVIGPDVGIQGNLDPTTLLLATDQVVVQQTNQILSEVQPNRKHIMNLGHGIDATTAEDRVKLFIDAVHAYKKQ